MTMGTVIIGGNTAGCMTALHLDPSEQPVILEQQARFSKVCSGILTQTSENLIPIPQKYVMDRIESVNIHFPSGNKTAIPFRTPDLVIDRPGFNTYLQDKAEQKGVRFIRNARFISFQLGAAVYKNQATGNEHVIPARHIVGADGAISTVARTAGILRRRSYFTGIKSIIRRKHENQVELYPYLKDLAWLSPATEDSMELGIVSRTEPMQAFAAFCHMLGINQPKQVQSALIPFYDPHMPTQVRTRGMDVYLVGDAATQVKATTAGGIIQGMIAARSAAEAITQGTSYPPIWKKGIGRDLWLHHKLRLALDKFSAKHWRQVEHHLKNPHLRQLASEQSRDTPSKMILKAIWHEPSIIGLGARVMAA